MKSIGRLVLTLTLAAIGGFAMWRFGLPLPWLLGAMFGASFHPGTAILRVMFLSVGSTVLLLVITPLFAFTISAVTGVPLAALVLAYSPGGIAGMSLVAVAIHIEAPFVVLHHIARVLIVIAGATDISFDQINRAVAVRRRQSVAQDWQPSVVLWGGLAKRLTTISIG